MLILRIANEKAICTQLISELVIFDKDNDKGGIIIERKRVILE